MVTSESIIKNNLVFYFLIFWYNFNINKTSNPPSLTSYKAIMNPIFFYTLNSYMEKKKLLFAKWPKCHHVCFPKGIKVFFRCYIHHWVGKLSICMGWWKICISELHLLTDCLNFRCIYKIWCQIQFVVNPIRYFLYKH